MMGSGDSSSGGSSTDLITLSQSPAAGTLVGLGAHTITVTATDAAGNSATCTTTFTVTDAMVSDRKSVASGRGGDDGGCQAAVPNVLGGVTASDSWSATK